jgi:ankyrin repeat protein
MRFLAANGADPNIPSLGNVTTLLAASGVGFWEGETPGSQAEAFEAIKLAYELGNDPKAVVLASTQKADASWLDATAMHGAANRGAVDMIRWLADKGVPLDKKSARGLSPYHIAAGLESGQFHAWPEAAALLLQIAKERGETIDTSEPPKTGRGLY